MGDISIIIVVLMMGMGLVYMVVCHSRLVTLGKAMSREQQSANHSGLTKVVQIAITRFFRE